MRDATRLGHGARPRTSLTLISHPSPHRYRDLPPELQLRIRKYYTFYWSRQSIFDEHAILDALPSHLRREVTLYLHKGHVASRASHPASPYR